MIFNSLFKYLHDNNLLTSTQSGFWASDFYIHKLLLISNEIEIHTTFDAKTALDIRAVILGLSMYNVLTK